jgi:O-acetyl-ADP-ribose deacetylase (regulator of RNase III)
MVKLIEWASFVQGDILDWAGKVDAIGHQVNCLGVMGGGLALQIKNKWPVVFETYVEFINSAIRETRSLKGCLGCCQLVQTDSCFVANLFGQYDVGAKLQTDYIALHRSLTSLREQMQLRGLDSVAFPAKLGCGLAGGDWNIVQSVIQSVFAGSGFSITIVEYVPHPKIQFPWVCIKR